MLIGWGVFSCPENVRHEYPFAFALFEKEISKSFQRSDEKHSESFDHDEMANG